MKGKLKTMMRWFEVMLLICMPVMVEAHGGHGDASVVQHEAQHAMWLLTAVVAIALTLVMLVKRSRQN